MGSNLLLLVFFPTLANRILDALSSDKRASIKINGEEFSRNQDGFNLVVVDYDTGAVESSENFDTTQDSGSAKSMTNFLRSLGNKKIVIGATKGNAGQFMFNDVYKSLVSYFNQRYIFSFMIALHQFFICKLYFDSRAFFKG